MEAAVSWLTGVIFGGGVEGALLQLVFPAAADERDSAQSTGRKYSVGFAGARYEAGVVADPPDVEFRGRPGMVPDPIGILVVLTPEPPQPARQRETAATASLAT